MSFESKRILFVFLSIVSFFGCFKDGSNSEVILEDAERYRSLGKYDSTIYLLADFVANETEDTLALLKAHTIISNTYKSIRNYDKAEAYLDKAISLAANNSKLLSQAVVLDFEKALILFDLTEYERSKDLMSSVRKNIAFLDSTSLGQFVMQEGYFEFLEGNYQAALNKYDESISILRQAAERHLPMVFPKKCEVYASMNDWVQAEAMVDSSMFYVKKHSIPLYEAYTMEIYEKYLISQADGSKIHEVNRKKKQAQALLNEGAENDKIAAAELDLKLETIRGVQKINRQFRILTALLGLSILWLFLASWKIYSDKRAMESQKNKLEELNYLKDHIFAVLGHDLRKPAIAFRGFAKKIKYLIERGDQKTLDEVGWVIEKDANTLFATTDNILNWAIIQKDGLGIVPQVIDLFQIVQENLDFFDPAIRKKEIDLVLRLEEPSLIKADQNAVATIVRNVLDNAIKYSHQGGLWKLLVLLARRIVS